jgi:hypothetical protein
MKDDRPMLYYEGVDVFGARDKLITLCASVVDNKAAALAGLQAGAFERAAWAEETTWRVSELIGVWVVPPHRLIGLFLPYEAAAGTEFHA